MLKLKELENRVYSGKECIRFEYTVKGERPEDNVLLMYTRLSGKVNSWRVRMLLDKTEYTDTQVYEYNLDMPKADVPLTLICETGLHFLQLLIKEEVQKKSMLDFAIGQIVHIDNIDHEVV